MNYCFPTGDSVGATVGIGSAAAGSARAEVSRASFFDKKLSTIAAISSRFTGHVCGMAAAAATVVLIAAVREFTGLVSNATRLLYPSDGSAIRYPK